MTPTIKTAPTFWVKIHMAGDVAAAIRLINDFCDDIGECVTVTPTTYVYTHGVEAGFTVGFINYPRFPREPHEIVSQATTLAKYLRPRLGQTSFSIETPFETTWHSYREQ